MLSLSPQPTKDMRKCLALSRNLLICYNWAMCTWYTYIKLYNPKTTKVKPIKNSTEFKHQPINQPIKITCYYKIKDNISMDGTVAGSLNVCSTYINIFNKLNSIAK